MPVHLVFERALADLIQAGKLQGHPSPIGEDEAVKPAGEPFLICMSPAEVGPFEPASFRDPAARVLRHDGQILRYLTPAAWRDFERLSSTRFYREFTDSGRLVATTPASRSQIPPLSDPWVAVLRHQTIPVVSYPYEWCFSMLQDAALLQIDLLLAALDEGMTLKDATPFNIQ